MIVISRILKPTQAALCRTGAAIQVPAGAGGAFTVHRGEPVIFSFNDEMCQMSLDAFCDATGRELDSLEGIFAFDCGDDDEHDDAALTDDYRGHDDIPAEELQNGK